jgi:hypothetical protein
MVTLHSGGEDKDREGRASEALDESIIKKDATSTKLVRMQDSIRKSLPRENRSESLWPKWGIRRHGMRIYTALYRAKTPFA